MAGDLPPVDAAEMGRVTRLNDAAARYVEYAKTTVPDRVRLSGLKVVLDCAHGAAYKAAPDVLWELGAEVIPVGVAPNGYNINAGCGSTHPEAAVSALRAHGADVALCLDGDADRIVIVDETGAVADGDQIMALMAADWAARGRLQHNVLVATVMSNLGLERFLQGQGITLKRTPVGDRYVVEAMRAGGYNLGGEQSGHIVMTDHATTGDGLVAGLQVLSRMKQTGLPASALTRSFEPVPQMLKNVRFEAGANPLGLQRVQAVIAEGEARLARSGRLLIRKSGTEPLIRVMGESEDEALLARVVEDIAGVIAELGTGG
jgi:phosphoglucosamine mutase